MTDQYKKLEELANHINENFSANPFVPIQANDLLELIAAVRRYRSALEYVANGCLVPPDGGSPQLQDAIDLAREALKEAE